MTLPGDGETIEHFSLGINEVSLQLVGSSINHNRADYVEPAVLGSGGVSWLFNVRGVSQPHLWRSETARILISLAAIAGHGIDNPVIDTATGGA